MDLITPIAETRGRQKQKTFDRFWRNRSFDWHLILAAAQIKRGMIVDSSRKRTLGLLIADSNIFFPRKFVNSLFSSLCFFIAQRWFDPKVDWTMKWKAEKKTSFHIQWIWLITWETETAASNNKQQRKMESKNDQLFKCERSIDACLCKGRNHYQICMCAWSNT